MEEAESQQDSFGLPIQAVFGASGKYMHDFDVHSGGDCRALPRETLGESSRKPDLSAFR